MIVDLFAGLGGWDLGARSLGIDDPLGIEWNPHAGDTRERLGLPTLRANIADHDPLSLGPVEGLIASPPCQDYSVAGSGIGRNGERGRLVEEVPRWVEALRPRWVAAEQVPGVLPIWREFAHRFEALGYRTWTGILSSEEYGVPQTRRRAILLASRDRTPGPPPPTRTRYRPRGGDHPTLFGLPRWESMADALGWTETGTSWPFTAPATTVAGDPRISARCHHDDGSQGANPKTTDDVRAGRYEGTEPIRLTEREALVLQGLPRDLDVAGPKAARFLQIGNAIPPPLAAAILSTLTEETA